MPHSLLPSRNIPPKFFAKPKRKCLLLFPNTVIKSNNIYIYLEPYSASVQKVLYLYSKDPYPTHIEPTSVPTVLYCAYIVPKGTHIMHNSAQRMPYIAHVHGKQLQCPHPLHYRAAP